MVLVLTPKENQDDFLKLKSDSTFGKGFLYVTNYFFV